MRSLVFGWLRKVVAWAENTPREDDLSIVKITETELVNLFGKAREFEEGWYFKEAIHFEISSTVSNALKQQYLLQRNFFAKWPVDTAELIVILC